MHRRVRPILGFGTAGWLLLPIAAALAYCAAGGFDLRHAIFAFLYDSLGERFVFHVVIRRVLFASYWSSLVGVVCGPITLIPVLIAMHLAPRDWTWWTWAGIAGWLVLNPWLCLSLGTFADPFVPSVLRFLASRSRPVQFVGDVTWVVLVQLAALALVARVLTSSAGRDTPPSRWRFIPYIIFALGAVLAVLAVVSDAQPTPWFSFHGHVLLGMLWHSAVTFLLIGGVLDARWSAIAHTWRCAGCGYDLRGIASPRGHPAYCSECGLDIETADTPSPGG